MLNAVRTSVTGLSVGFGSCPVLASFKKEVAAMRARGCSEAEVEKYIGQIESNFMIMAATKTDALTPELIQDFMEMFREAARKPDEGGKTD